MTAVLDSIVVEELSVIDSQPYGFVQVYGVVAELSELVEVGLSELAVVEGGYVVGSVEAISVLDSVVDELSVAVSHP